MLLSMASCRTNEQSNSGAMADQETDDDMAQMNNAITQVIHDDMTQYDTSRSSSKWWFDTSGSSFESIYHWTKSIISDNPIYVIKFF